MKKARLIKNSLSAIVQVVIVGGVYFVLYWYLLKTIGIELLGVWSLIIATTSLALIANFGISTSIIKFVSTYYTRKDFDSLRQLIFTSLLFILGTYAIIGIILLITGRLILEHFIDAEYLEIALAILPYSIISLIINALNGVMSSALDGIQKSYLRSYILSASSIMLLVVSTALAPSYGLAGLIYAQILQAVLVLLLSAVSLSRNIKGIFNFKWNWSKRIFREIIDYGLKMQSLSLMQMSFEPVTKALLSKFGGLAMVGYYEMASRLVTQLRSLIVNANQVVIPVVAEAKETDVGFIKQLYLKTFSIILFLNIILTSAIIISAPLISILWIGEVVPFFIFSVIINSAVVFVNISSNPAYFSFMGEGKLNWLIKSYVAVTIINIVCGYVLGHFFGAYGVVLAWNLAFLAGSLIIIWSFHRTNAILWSTVINKNNLVLTILSVLLCFFAYNFTIGFLKNSIDYTSLLGSLIFAFLFIKTGLINENFILIIGEIRRLIFKKSS
ncbi:MAG TPA: oligosaccharide flippase family protein [Flavobacterium sp.]